MKVKVIKRIIVVILILLMFISAINVEEIAVFAKTVLSYDDYDPPNGGKKPKVGMKLIVNHKDGTKSEKWINGDNTAESLKAFVGDTVTVKDWSTTGSGKKLVRWDFQYYDAKKYHKDVKSAQQGAVIETLTLDNVGTYEFYLCVQDDYSPNGIWENWSDNGNHTAQKELDNGVIFEMDFVRLDIEVSVEKPPEPEYIKAILTAPSQVDKGEEFTLDSSASISSSPIIRKTFYKKSSHKSSWENEESVKDSINETTPYMLEIENEQGLTDSVEITVLCLGGERDESIICDFKVRKEIDDKGYVPFNAGYFDNSYKEGYEDEEFRGIKSWSIKMWSPYHDYEGVLSFTKDEIERSGKSVSSYIGVKLTDLIQSKFSGVPEGEYDTRFKQTVYDLKGNWNSSSEKSEIIISTEPPTTTVEETDNIISKFKIVKEHPMTVEHAFGIQKHLNYSNLSYYKGHEGEKYKGIDRLELKVLGGDRTKNRSNKGDIIIDKKNFAADDDFNSRVTDEIAKEIRMGVLFAMEQGRTEYYMTIYQWACDTSEFESENRIVRSKTPHVEVIHFSFASPPEKEKPETIVSAPNPFFPKEVVGYDDNKTITWTYSSPQNVPYRESKVSVYKKVGEGEVALFENKVVKEKKLKIDANAREQLRCEVIVIDQNGIESNIAYEAWNVQDCSVNIDLIIEKSGEILKTKVINLNLPEFEEKYPTSYTNWVIKNASGETILQGDGKIPEIVNLDENLEVGKYTVTQNAVNILGVNGSDTEEFGQHSVLDFYFSRFHPFETEVVKVIDLCEGVNNKIWKIKHDDDTEFKPLESMEFTRAAGEYKVKLSGDGYFYDGDNTAHLIREITFLSAKPVADFKINGTKKMYKELIIDGSVSDDATDAYLQQYYPNLYDNPKTRFIIEPLNDDGTEVDYSKNEFIKGQGKEIIDGKVTFKATSFKQLRFDKDGWYRISYKITNDIKESEWKIKEICIAPELSLDVNIVADPVTYRNPNNELKSKMTISVNYNSLDNDLLDQDKSKLIISYDENGNNDFSDDGANNNQCYSKNESNLQSYIDSIESTFTANQVIYNVYVDNPDKNVFGYFKFDFEGIEKPSVPNYIELGAVPVIKADTLEQAINNKKILIDNNKPVLNLQTTSSNTIEIFIMEESYNPIDAKRLKDKLELNNMNVIMYIIKKNGEIEKIE